MKRRFTQKNQLVNSALRVGGVASGTIGGGFVSDKLLTKVGMKKRSSKGLVLMGLGSLMVPYATNQYMEGVADGMIARGIVETGRALDIVEPINGVGTAEEFVGAYDMMDYDDYDDYDDGDFVYSEDGEVVSGTDNEAFIGS